MNRVCICRSCADWRENRLMTQHGLTGTELVYMARRKGAFVPRPSPNGDVSIISAMLVDLGAEPVIFIQGHRNCAAVGVLYNAVKQGEASNDAAREFMRSHGHIAEMVIDMGAHLTSEQQLKILEEICVLASINNDLEHLSPKDMCSPVFYALLSETPPGKEVQHMAAENIGLMIYDPSQGAFGKMPAAQGNIGIRITDFIGEDMRRIDEMDGFGITAPIDLETATHNAMRWTMAGEVPTVNRPVRDCYRDKPAADCRT